jgi:hypothetical protein
VVQLRSEILYGVRKNVLLGVKNVKIGTQSPKTESVLLCDKSINQEFCTKQEKICFLGVEKAKISFQGTKSVWSCDISDDISIDQEF